MDGQVVPIGERKLTSDEIENAITPALMPHSLRQYLEIRIADSSYRNTNLGRFRINLHQERGRAAATIRALPRPFRFCMSCIFRRQLNSLRTCLAVLS